MAFGFPAYHTEHYQAHHDMDLRAKALAAVAQLCWTLREERSTEILISTGMGLRSWGEKVTITFEPDRAISVTSRCALPTQCFDWGKNKSNVEKYIAALQADIAQGVASNR